MAGIYYAAVEDDPLTSGKGSRVFALKPAGTIQGEDGRHRRLAFIGDEAYCPKCNSTGVITYGSGLGDRHRLIDLVHGGRRQAVGGDIVLCKCVDHPRIIAIYGRSWIINDRGDMSQQATRPTAHESESYDQHFILKNERTGKPLANMPYKIVTEDGFSIEGRTDSQGRTSKVSSGQAVTATVHIFEEETPINPDWDKYL